MNWNKIKQHWSVYILLFLGNGHLLSNVTNLLRTNQDYFWELDIEM